MPTFKAQPEPLKIMLLGDAKAGKTSLMTRYTKNIFNNLYKPTIGVDFETKLTSFKSISLKLNIWDQAGEERFKAMVINIFLNTQVFIFVVDVTNPQSLETVKKEYGKIFTGGYLEKATTMLVVTKMDATDTDRKVSETELIELAEALNCNTPLAKQLGCKAFYETSAKDNTGIEEAFTAAAKLGLSTIDPKLSFLTDEEAYDLGEDEDDVKPVLTCGTKIAACLRHLFCCGDRRGKKPHDYHTLIHETPSQNL